MRDIIERLAKDKKILTVKPQDDGLAIMIEDMVSGSRANIYVSYVQLACALNPRAMIEANINSCLDKLELFQEVTSGGAESQR